MFVNALLMQSLSICTTANLYTPRGSGAGADFMYQASRHIMPCYWLLVQAVLARRTCMPTACERSFHKHSRRALVCLMIALHEIRHASTCKACAAFKRSFNVILYKHAHVTILAIKPNLRATHVHICSGMCECNAQPTEVACSVFSASDLT